jgi:hypothetical protein
MNPRGNDSSDSSDAAALQRLFSERQRRDEAAAPGFERVVHRPARGAGAGGWRRVPASAGLLLLALVLAVAGIVWRQLPGPAPLPAASADRPTLASGSATWKAPTDFLLAVPGRELLDSTPSFPDPQIPAPPSGS